MKTYLPILLSVVSWWVTATAVLLVPPYLSQGHLYPDWGIGVATMLVFGTIYAVPMALYFAWVDRFARSLVLPARLAVFALGVGAWFGLTWLVFGRNAILFVIASIPAVAVVLLRQIAGPRAAAGIKSSI
jgi:hypothetical protein